MVGRIAGTFAVALLALLGAQRAWAEEPAWLSLGEPWERPIYAGIDAQDRERKRLRSDALVHRYKMLAARPAKQDEMVRRHYLHARALGLQYAALLAEVDAASSEAQQTQLRREARAAFDGAMRAYRDALSFAPQCYFCYHDMGILELQRERPNEDAALRNLARASEINPRYPAPLRKRVLVLTAKQRWREAIPVLRRLIDLEPQDVVARVTLAGAYAEVGELETAYVIAKQLMDHDPANPMFRGLVAQLDFRAGKLDEAQAAYRALAEEMPTNPRWLNGVMACIKRREELKSPVDPEDVVWVLNGLLRLERDPKRRQQLREQLAGIRKQIAEGSGMGDPKKPPTAEDLVRVMTGQNEEGRYKVLSFLNAISEAPPEALMKGVMSRLAHTSEPSPRVRALAVEIVGKHMGYGFLPILRAVGLDDPAASVRLAAVDAMTRMADIAPPARGAAVLSLGLLVDDDERSVGSAARLGLLQLGRGRLRVDEHATAEEHRRAFTAWWAGPEGEDLKIKSLEDYPRLKDRWVENVLLVYLDDASFFVRQAAFDAFVAVARFVATPEGAAWYQRLRAGDHAEFRGWLAALPRPTGGRLTEANEAQMKPQLAAWIEKRP